MNIKKLIHSTLIGIICFLISFSLLQNYTGGDQVPYRIFYEKIADLSFWDVGLVAKSVIDSNEPLAWFVLWLGSYIGIDKDVWISFLNVVLILGLFALLVRHKAPWYVSLLIFTNFYIFVLMTSAERLKISYILLIFAFLSVSYKRYIFLFLTPFAHLQSIIFLAGLALFSLHGVITDSVKKFKIKPPPLIKSVFLIIMTTPLILLLESGIVSKLNKYLNSSLKIEFASITILLVLTTIVTPNKMRMLLAFVPMFSAVFLIGGFRVNMVAVTLALGILMLEQRLKHPLVLLLLFYFSFKSILFVYNIYIHGEGFYDLSFVEMNI